MIMHKLWTRAARWIWIQQTTKKKYPLWLGADRLFLFRLRHDLMCTFKAFVISSRKVGKNHYFFWHEHPLQPRTLMVSNMSWTILTVISLKVKINLLIVNIVNIFCVSLIIKIYKMRGNWVETRELQTFFNIVTNWTVSCYWKRERREDI